jgi:NADPH:quinone reductase-like Zn-dependent oxidoreductase
LKSYATAATCCRVRCRPEQRLLRGVRLHPQDTLAGRLKAGQQVLLVGASGGVGLFAIQFAIQIAKALGRRGTRATMRAIVQDKYACPELGARASPWRHPRIGGQ